MQSKDKLELVATMEIESNLELYKIVDFLNKTLKNKDLIFGLVKKNDKMQITVYET